MIVVAVVVAVISDPVNAWARESLWPVVGSSRVLAEIASWTVLGGSYRLTNLLPFFLLGALLMRHGQKRDRVLWTMAVIAPIAYAVRPLFTALFDVQRVPRRAATPTPCTTWGSCSPRTS